MSELAEEDTEITEVEIGDNTYFYIFAFVGVIVVLGRVLKCYPKYIKSNPTPKSELKQVIKVLERYNSEEQIINMFNYSGEGESFNLLAVLLFLIYDYYENNIYSNTVDIIENNGNGEILWDRTINDTFTLISKNRPYYIDYKTRKRTTNDYDYFKRLHECILTKASNELKDADLLDLFEITEVNLSDYEIEDFGDEDYILYRIERELHTQYNTRKQIILKTMYAYIKHNETLHDLNCLSLFGTCGFNIVWEKVCAEIFNNQLEKKLSDICLPLKLKQHKYKAETKLKNIIEKPLWTITGNTAKDTLVPDIISINDNQFVILDAKYYCPELKPNSIPKRQPGIESVTKQYLYQLAYKEFTDDHGFESIKNCFILPTEKDGIHDKEVVSLKMLQDLGLENISIRLISADLAFSNYLSGQNIDINMLQL